MHPHARTILITGGARGIGRAIAEHCIADDATVFVMDNDRAAGRETETALRARGTVTFLPGDVSVEADVVRTLETVHQRAGRLDVLVNNAGIMVRKPPAELSLEDWNRVLGVNLTGAFLCSKHAAPLLTASKGLIVNIASTRALMSEPNTEAYSASKGGLLALTHALALSLGPAVRVNCISPGWIDVSGGQPRPEPALLRAIDHAQHPAGRVGRPEDVAALVHFLARDEAGFITGAEFIVDGGMTRKMIYAE